MKITLTFAIVLLIVLNVFSQSPLSIIPKPVSVIQPKGKAFWLKTEFPMIAPEKFRVQANYLCEAIQKQCAIQLDLSIAKTSNRSLAAITIIEDSTLKHTEQYQLSIKANGIFIRVNDARGLVNATQTLLQLLPIYESKTALLSPLEINDYPRFSYRGMHLDVVRHIFPLSYIKKYIDYLAFHKFNTFHWHLTDDQGWRMEMKNYPKLNSIASWRAATLIGHFKDNPPKYDSTIYGGFYTKKEIKEVVDYAAVRAINIIPEIDIPGHSRAVIAAYPQLSTKPDTTWNVATTWGMYNRQNNVLAPKPETFSFLESVFEELLEIFPSKYIHVGGDECSKIWWKQDTASQAFMRLNGLKNETQLQTYFIEFIAQFLKQKGRQTIGWHEINEGELDTTTIVMNWGTEKQAIDAASKGFSVINTPGKPLYFDHYQSQNPNDSLSIHGYNPLEAVYNYEPIPKAILDKGLENKIIGGQANVWTEYMENEKKVDYMVLPRMTALSETLWTPSAQKSYPDFLKRLEETIIPRYQLWNSSWYKEYRKWDASSKLPNVR